MTGTQLGSRMESRPQTLEAIEKSEASGTIRLNTPRRGSDGLHLVYALVLNGSLEIAVNERARRSAMQELHRVAQTMRKERTTPISKPAFSPISATSFPSVTCGRKN
jgi:hypothetical protein